MMKRIQLILVLALLAVPATRAGAQVFTFSTDAERGWLGFSFQRTETRRPGERVLTLTVTSVAPESPAQRAGLQQGDAILRINGLNATEQLLATLSTSLTPGDTVTFRIRRDDAERDLQLVAASWPNHMRMMITPRALYDSAASYLQIYMDSARARLRPLRIEVAGDSIWQRLPGGDSLLLSWLPRNDTSYWQRLPNGDSALVRRFIWRDSARADWPGGRMFGFSRELPGQDIVVGTWGFSRRAIAGAELQALNPELAHYFEVERGVLVVNAPEGTPARRAGLRPGDVITAVDGEAVSDVADVRRAIDRASGDSVRIDYIRRGEEQNLKLKK